VQHIGTQTRLDYDQPLSDGYRRSVVQVQSASDERWDRIIAARAIIAIDRIECCLRRPFNVEEDASATIPFTPDRPSEPQIMVEAEPVCRPIKLATTKEVPWGSIEVYARNVGANYVVALLRSFRKPACERHRRSGKGALA
jgi:hypothetical protein